MERGTGRLYALGRLPQGVMNKAEARYEYEVLKPAQQAGEVLWYRFEAIKLRLAPNTFLTVDFAVLPRSGVLELHDVKGGRRIYFEDAKVKMKVAADAYPFVFKVAFPPARKGAAWEIDEVGA
jgi:hypothetical protein